MPPMLAAARLREHRLPHVVHRQRHGRSKDDRRATRIDARQVLCSPRRGRLSPLRCRARRSGSWLAGSVSVTPSVRTWKLGRPPMPATTACVTSRIAAYRDVGRQALAHRVDGGLIDGRRGDEREPLVQRRDPGHRGRTRHALSRDAPRERSALAPDATHRDAGGLQRQCLAGHLGHHRACDAFRPRRRNGCDRMPARSRAASLREVSCER